MSGRINVFRLGEQFMLVYDLTWRYPRILVSEDGGDSFRLYEPTEYDFREILKPEHWIKVRDPQFPDVTRWLIRNTSAVTFGGTVYTQRDEDFDPSRANIVNSVAEVTSR